MGGVISRHSLAALIGLAAVLSCSSSEGPPPTGSNTDPNAVPLGRNFDIRIGERVEVGEGGLSIAFQEVREDSRCPLDVNCVWEGDAGVVLELAIGRRSTESVTLHTTLEPRATAFEDHEVRLVKLAPAPVSESPIPPDAYVATLAVGRH